MPERNLSFKRPGAILLVGLVVMYVLALLVAPLVGVLYEALRRGLGPLIAALTEPDVITAFRITLTLALVAVAVNTVAGLVLAWVLVRHQFPGRRLLNALVDAPFIFSPVIAGYAMLVLFGRNGWFTPTPFPVVFATPGMVLAVIFVTLPFVVRELQPALAALSISQEEAAHTLGASRWQTFFRVVLPQVMVALLYGVVLTFARAIGDFGAVGIIGGGIEGVTETATVYLYRAFNDRNRAGAYGVAVMLCLLSVSALLLMRALRRNEKAHA
jgi:sulfate/thiosulfate transport system permease protein